MTPEEFIKIMDDNASDFEEFAALSPENKVKLANYRIMTGPTKAFYGKDGTLQGVGGISINGVGEAWTITRRDIQSHPDRNLRPGQFIDLIRDTRQIFGKMCDEHELNKVFGMGKLSMSFLEHLGFEKSPNTMIWTRK